PASDEEQRPAASRPAHSTAQPPRLGASVSTHAGQLPQATLRRRVPSTAPMSLRLHLTVVVSTTLLCLAGGRLALAQGTDEHTTAPAPLVAERGTKQLHAFRITGESPKIDGRFDDETWQLAEKAEDFVQQEPDNMSGAGERTIVQVAYDDRYLYVAARCLVH